MGKSRRNAGNSAKQARARASREQLDAAQMVQVPLYRQRVERNRKRYHRPGANQRGWQDGAQPMPACVA